MESRVNIDLAGGYQRRREMNILRIESDSFKICEPKVVRAQDKIISEKVWIVHVPEKGRIRTKLLKGN